MAGNVLLRSDWYLAGKSAEYAEYLLRARQRYNQGEAATVKKVKAIYRRVAEELRREIENVTPGTLRYGHLRALSDALDRAANRINAEVLEAIRLGIYLAVEEAALGAEQITLAAMKGVVQSAEIRSLFAAINERANLAVLSKTYHDGLKLSDRIWRTSRRVRQALDKLVEDAVIRGLDSRVLARDVQRYLQPDVWTPLKEETRRRFGVPRDVSMEAMRVAVTEMQHAFHEGTIQSYQHVPGCQGFYWRLSSSHPIPDICDFYSRRGGNGFWRKDEVPPKPHPWCRCVLIPAMEDPVKFARRLRKWVNDPRSQPDIESWFETLRSIAGGPRSMTPGVEDVLTRFWRGDNLSTGDLIEVRNTMIEMARERYIREVLNSSGLSFRNYRVRPSGGDIYWHSFEFVTDLGRRTVNWVSTMNDAGEHLRKMEEAATPYELLQAFRSAFFATAKDPQHWRYVAKDVSDMLPARVAEALKKSMSLGRVNVSQALNLTERLTYEPGLSVPEREKMARLAQEAENWLRGVVGENLTSRINKIRLLGAGKNGRAYYNPSLNLIVFYAEQGMYKLTDKQIIGSIVHEFGHHLHSSNDSVLQLIDTWFKERKQSNSMVWTTHSGERGYVDQFFDYYVGRDYGKRYEGTEVFSMGLQYLFEDPVLLAVADPDHMALILALVKGAVR